MAYEDDWIDPESVTVPGPQVEQLAAPPTIQNYGPPQIIQGRTSEWAGGPNDSIQTGWRPPVDPDAPLHIPEGIYDIHHPYWSIIRDREADRGRQERQAEQARTRVSLLERRFDRRSDEIDQRANNQAGLIEHRFNVPQQHRFAQLAERQNAIDEFAASQPDTPATRRIVDHMQAGVDRDRNSMRPQPMVRAGGPGGPAGDGNGPRPQDLIGHPGYDVQGQPQAGWSNFGGNPMIREHLATGDVWQVGQNGAWSRIRQGTREIDPATMLRLRHDAMTQLTNQETGARPGEDAIMAHVNASIRATEDVNRNRAEERAMTPEDRAQLAQDDQRLEVMRRSLGNVSRDTGPPDSPMARNPDRITALSRFDELLRGATGRSMRNWNPQQVNDFVRGIAELPPEVRAQLGVIPGQPSNDAGNAAAGGAGQLVGAQGNRNVPQASPPAAQPQAQPVNEASDDPFAQMTDSQARENISGRIRRELGNAGAEDVQRTLASALRPYGGANITPAVDFLRTRDQMRSAITQSVRSGPLRDHLQSPTSALNRSVETLMRLVSANRPLGDQESQTFHQTLAHIQRFDPALANRLSTLALDIRNRR